MIKKEGRTKSKDAMVAEPEMVYGWGGVMEGYFMQYVVPKKDVSFVRDLAKVRGWKLYDKKEAGMYRHSELSKTIKKAMEDVKAGRVYHADSVDDMFEQILGKGWKEKDKTMATGKKVGRKKE